MSVVKKKAKLNVSPLGENPHVGGMFALCSGANVGFQSGGCSF